MAWNSWLLCSGGVLFAYVVYLIVYKWKRGVCRESKQLDGKTVVVTGANTGIGYYTALDLASRNARVILACRDGGRGRAAVESIQKQTGNLNVELMFLDLASFASVRDFAQRFNETEERLDILVNNAGVCFMDSERRMTSDGLEMTYQVNHFSHFLLTLLLLDKVKACSPSRVVVVSSHAHKMSRSLDFQEFRGLGITHDFQTYWHTKVCNILFARELARKLEGTGVTVNSLHPGSVYTDFYRNLKPGFKTVFLAFARLACRSAESGAQTSLYVALSDDVASTSGQYFSDCHPAQPNALASDDALARKLWEASEDITGQQF